MRKIINVEKAEQISKKLRHKGKRIVLAGGVFDILHVGHIKFLEAAKRQGDFLIVLLESDESVRISKGKKRPVNNQKDRAIILSALASVDFVVILNGVLKNKTYDKIIKQISPKILTTTAKDPGIKHKIRQAKLTGAKLIEVMKKMPNKSTSQIINSLK